MLIPMPRPGVTHTYKVDPVTKMWNRIPDVSHAEPEWKVGDRFDSDVGPGQLVEVRNWSGSIVGVSVRFDDGKLTRRSYETFLRCVRRPGETTNGPPTPTDRVCSNPTCARTCDTDRPCWWCGGVT